MIGIRFFLSHNPSTLILHPFFSRICVAMTIRSGIYVEIRTWWVRGGGGQIFKIVMTTIFHFHRAFIRFSCFSIIMLYVLILLLFAFMLSSFSFHFHLPFYTFHSFIHDSIVEQHNFSNLFSSYFSSFFDIK